jgi:hypothetical protein
MAAPKGSKKYHNPETGEVTIRVEHPGEPWIPGIPDNQKNPKGNLVWHDPKTAKHIRRSEDPGEPWVRGWHPDRLTSCGNGNRGKKQDEKVVRRRAEAVIRRHSEEGLSEAEQEGHRKVSRKLKGRTIPQVQRDQIRGTLTGRKTGYNPARCRKVSERLKCNTVYLLKITTPSGLTFGKWGATRNGDSRWKTLVSRGMVVEVLGIYLCGVFAPAVEEEIGRTLGEYPANLGDFTFGGHTETFEWSEKTQLLLKEIQNGLEKSASPERNG